MSLNKEVDRDNVANCRRRDSVSEGPFQGGRGRAGRKLGNSAARHTKGLDFCITQPRLLGHLQHQASNVSLASPVTAKGVQFSVIMQQRAAPDNLERV